MSEIRLDYGLEPPIWKRPNYHRWTIRILLTLGVLVALAICIPILVERLLLLHWQRECSLYVGTPNQVVYSNDPVEVPALLRSGNGYRSDGGTALSPEPWNQLQWRFGVIGEWPQSVLFLHQRISKGGESRIVSVTFDATNPRTSISGISIDPASFFGRGTSSINKLGLSDVGLSKTTGGTVRFFAGQTDPNDDSHFTIDCDCEGRRRVVDGWLLDDMSSIAKVNLQLRPFPTSTTGSGTTP